MFWWANHQVFVPRQQALDLELPADLRRTADRLRAGAWATLWTALLVAAIVVGSRNLQNFDPALVIYTFAVVFATWGVIYHYNVWLEKPPTRVYWERGWELFRRRGVVRGLLRVSALAATHLAGQTLHRAPLAAALVDAPVPLLGLPAGRRHHLSRWSSAGFTSARFPATR